LVAILLLTSIDVFARRGDAMTNAKNTEPKLSVLVTGALSGIGRATAIAFAREGARVMVSGRHKDKGDALVAELRELGADAEFVLADVRADEEMRKLVDAAIARFGRLDVAVNNAGTEGMRGPVTDQTQESYAATFDTNVLGTLLGMKHELRAMLAQKAGSIVNVSSMFGHGGVANGCVYSASKHAVEGLTKSAALEVAGSGVRVNAVAPGPIETEMLNRFTRDDAGKAGLVSTIPLKRAGMVDEVARAIVFLASADASFMTGVVLDVDGGAAAA
jgi:NAD(P)-dependent dehydrogenase (short-subunit alcohol dehydrogenase family)